LVKAPFLSADAAARFVPCLGGYHDPGAGGHWRLLCL
jgi:hypothetical protein